MMETKRRLLVLAVLELVLMALGWTFVNFGFILSVLNHLTVSWILAAVGEEIVYRGFMQNRIIGLFANRATGIVVAILASSLFLP